MQHIRRLLPDKFPVVLLDSIEDTLDRIKEDIGLPYYQKQDNSTIKIRKQIIDWMIIVTSKLKLSDSCFYLQVEILDSFFENKEHDLDSNDFHMLAIGAIRIASKIEEIYCLTMSTTIKHLCHNRFTKEDLIVYELFVLKTIKYKIKSNYFKDFVFVVFEIFYKNNSLFEFIDYFDFVYKLCIFNYKFYRSMKKIYLYLSISYFCLKKFKNENKMDFQECKFLEFVDIFGCNLKEIYKFDKKISALKENFSNEGTYQYFKEPIVK